MFWINYALISNLLVTQKCYLFQYFSILLYCFLIDHMTALYIYIKVQIPQTGSQRIRFFIIKLLLSYFIALFLILIIPIVSNIFLLNLGIYFCVSNPWAFIFFLNFLLKSRSSRLIYVDLFLSQYLLLHFYNLRCSYFPVFSNTSLFCLFAYTYTVILGVWAQSKLGTRFFLPSFLRSRVYDRYTHKIRNELEDQR
jgi:hypothetical protein